MLGDQVLRKLEVEIAERKHTGQGGHAVLEGRTGPVPSSLNGSPPLSQTLGSSPEFRGGHLAIWACVWGWRSHSSHSVSRSRQSPRSEERRGGEEGRSRW